MSCISGEFEASDSFKLFSTSLQEVWKPSSGDSETEFQEMIDYGVNASTRG